jgi:hypothetical protein
MVVEPRHLLRHAIRKKHVPALADNAAGAVGMLDCHEDPRGRHALIVAAPAGRLAWREPAASDFAAGCVDPYAHVPAPFVRIRDDAPCAELAVDLDRFRPRPALRVRVAAGNALRCRPGYTALEHDAEYRAPRKRSGRAQRRPADLIRADGCTSRSVRGPGCCSFLSAVRLSSPVAVAVNCLAGVRPAAVDGVVGASGHGRISLRHTRAHGTRDAAWAAAAPPSRPMSRDCELPHRSVARLAPRDVLRGTRPVRPGAERPGTPANSDEYVELCEREAASFSQLSH